MSISLNVDCHKLNITFMINGSFKLGNHSEVYNYLDYHFKTNTGALGLGFLTIFYSKTTHY